MKVVSPLACLCVLLVAGCASNDGIDKLSGWKLAELARGVLRYADAHSGRLPDSLTDIKPYVPAYDAIIVSPRTGESPGYIYEKPGKNIREVEEGKGTSGTIILYECVNGEKRDRPCGFLDTHWDTH